MDWEKLKSGRCPKDEGVLFERGGAYVYCEACPFTIGKEKFREITGKNPVTVWENRRAKPMFNS